jgi:hypothetical protein
VWVYRIACGIRERRTKVNLVHLLTINWVAPLLVSCYSERTEMYLSGTDVLGR